MNKLQNVALRQNAIFISNNFLDTSKKELTGATTLLVAKADSIGFTFSEPLLRALNNCPIDVANEAIETLKDVLSVRNNWTPLVKSWNIPTGETRTDHLITFLYNVFKIRRGTTLQCGHLIPDKTFPLERYNGCPFCGTPFEFAELENYGQGSTKRVMDLWTEKEATAFLASLLTSKTALDATQMDNLKILLQYLPLPTVEVGMKETLMAVIDILVEADKAEEATLFFKTPTDILRYLWFKNTGFLQVVAPKTIIKRMTQNATHYRAAQDTSTLTKVKSKADLKLKYSRKECRVVANWLNELPMTAEKACEMMHPKRGMWVRLIRALRLNEYSKKKGMESLARLLEVFYAETYDVWQGEVNYYRDKMDAPKTFELLKQRPGAFARSLFSNMLWFGDMGAMTAFAEVVDKVPARLVFTLNMYAQNYFNPAQNRSVKPLGGVTKKIAANPLLQNYTAKQLQEMIAQTEMLCELAMEKRFAAIENENQTIFIEPQLYKIPVSIGDRSESVQDLPAALMGTRFPIEGDTVRLFMQWGKGLPAQHLDMDLSCMVAYDDRVDRCSYSQLTTTGCQHSGDIQAIPNQVGTAEYIDVNVTALRKAKARYVTFTCNSYSSGSITPNLVVGWMNSAYPMRISKSGVAYDPSCVQHQVRVTQGLTKGLVFGVLDIEAAEVVWLEMSYHGQVVQNLNTTGVEALLAKLDSKLSIGNLLEIKAKAQGLTMLDDAAADEVYDLAWAKDTAQVTQLLVD